MQNKSNFLSATKCPLLQDLCRKESATSKMCFYFLTKNNRKVLLMETTCISDMSLSYVWRLFTPFDYILVLEKLLI